MWHFAPWLWLAWWLGPSPEATELVLFVVLDTVRADRTSLCGYHRPTTPTLEGLRDGGASFTCRAYTPGAWTLPSHASYFTGLSVPEHGADRAERPLPDSLPTLAERFAERGFQTAMLSANALLSAETGLTRGFETLEVANPPEGHLRKNRLGTALDALLGTLSTERPLFLFVNVIDAHDPWRRIPDGIDWVPPQPTLHLHANSDDPNTPYNRFVTGRMVDREATAFLHRVDNAYDYGVHTADANLASVLDRLTDAGWMNGEVRLVVTSDHGEFLGEHGMLRHGCLVYEPVTRVPLVFHDNQEAAQPNLGAAPLAAHSVFELVLNGRLPDKPLLVASASRQRNEPFRPSADMAAVWTEGHDKLVWRDGATEWFDLVSDPDELAPRALGEQEGRAALDDYVRSLEPLRAPTGAADPALIDRLRALGYMTD